MRFGRQRPPADVLAIALLFCGFTGLAVAFRYYTESWLGLLLPVSFAIGAWSTLRTEVREVEIHPDTLLVRTFFKTYPMPRVNIVRVVLTPTGPAVDALNGARYILAPPSANLEQVARALEEWVGGNTEH